MIKNIHCIVHALLFLIIFNLSAIGQNKYLEPHLGGEFVFNENKIPCLTEEQRSQITEENIQAINELKARGIISENSNLEEAGSFIWPTRAASNLSDFSYYGISGFMDHNPAYPNQLLDYNGGQRTYDLQDGYNHQGTDIFTWPFAWYKMDNSQVEVISAADGVIIGKYDGNNDRSCTFGGGSWNAVYVRHADDVVAWYGHMKKFSTTTKNVGDSVFAGEYLGIVGSSGVSTGPHLHLEIHDASWNVIDPWAGPSNSTITSSWWADQRPYNDSKVNAIRTHSNWPFFPDCPQQETPYFQDEFAPGESVYFITYYQDQLANQVSNYSIKTPENTTWQGWNHSLSDPYANASYWGWSWTLPSNASLGTWIFSVFYEGNQYSHEFIVTNSPTDVDDEVVAADEFSLGNNYPNPFNPTTVINFNLPKEDFVTLRIFDISGRLVKILVNEIRPAGNYNLEFNASELSSGTYYYKLQTDSFVETKKMILLK